ncbi:MAG: hypothetical protein RSC24_06460 [Clostridium sp.]
MRKNKSYKIRITLLDGSVEDVKCKGVNINSYSSMMVKYREVKKTHSKKSKSIEFYGVDENGKPTTLFKKENNNIHGRKELNQDSAELMNDISNQIKLLKDKKVHHQNLVRAYDKKENFLLHSIESISKLNLPKEDLINEKLRIVDNIEQIRKDRRWHKNQLYTIREAFKNNDELSMDKLETTFKSIEAYQDKFEYLDERLAKSKKIYEEYTYVSDKDLQNKIKHYKKEYSHICIDESQNKLIAYNNAGVI